MPSLPGGAQKRKQYAARPGWLAAGGRGRGAGARSARGASRAADETPAAGVTHPAQAGAPGSELPDAETRRSAAIAGAAYGMLLLLGVVVGVYGAVYHASLSVWRVPVGALVAVAAVFLVCRAAGLLLRTRPAALLPAVGWLVAVVALSSRRPEGDLLITGSAGGYVLLFGGAVAAAVAVTMSFLDRTRPPSGPGDPH